MISLLKNLAIVAVATLVIWMVARLFGFQLAIVPSLIGSLLLTLILNMVTSRRALREA